MLPPPSPEHASALLEATWRSVNTSPSVLQLCHRNSGFLSSSKSSRRRSLTAGSAVAKVTTEATSGGSATSATLAAGLACADAMMAAPFEASSTTTSAGASRAAVAAMVVGTATPAGLSYPPSRLPPRPMATGHRSRVAVNGDDEVAATTSWDKKSRPRSKGAKAASNKSISNAAPGSFTLSSAATSTTPATSSRGDVLWPRPASSPRCTTMLLSQSRSVPKALREKACDASKQLLATCGTSEPQALWLGAWLSVKIWAATTRSPSVSDASKMLVPDCGVCEPPRLWPRHSASNTGLTFATWRPPVRDGSE
mmetsp:Transcript_75190/g.189238  ORF Transcript_75190/g.189238 Transcript_75190/m.189238 type:complete len:311 (-) Transcript_75190:500-1432(-)